MVSAMDMEQMEALVRRIRDNNLKALGDFYSAERCLVRYDEVSRQFIVTRISDGEWFVEDGIP